MTILFWLLATFCLYTYVVFPLLLHWRAQRVKPLMPLPVSQWPPVSVVIAVHNESANIEKKIASLQQLDYPADALEVIFVSDGSTDDSVALIRQYMLPTWQLLEYERSAGKPTALNLGVQHATGDILVFMDARQQVSSNAIKALVPYLQDLDVGAVSGELILTDERGGDAPQVSLYWRYEKWIRTNESRLFSTTGATGALYAIRRTSFVPHANDVLLDDFDTPVRLLRERKRTLLVSEARVFDRAESDVDDEYRRKVRTLAGNLQSFMRHGWLFNPRKNPVWWQFMSHKVFRLLVPYALILVLVASGLGDGPVLQSAFWLQTGFYGLGVLSLFGLRNRLANVARLFIKMNAAAIVGAYNYLSGNVAVRWKQT